MADIRPIRRMPTELQRLRAHAQQLMSNHRHELAEDVLRRILAIVPNDAGVHRQLASCLMRLRRTSEALDQAKGAVALDPLAAANLSVLAAIHMELGQLDDAIAGFERALQSKADYVPAIHGLSAALAGQAKWEPALTWTETGLAIKPDHAGMLRVRAESLAALNRNEEATATIQLFLRLEPDSDLSHAAASRILKRIGQTAEAADFARRALGISPADPNLHNSLAQLNLKERRYDDADRHFKHATEIYESRRDGQKGSKQIEIRSLLGQAAVNLRRRNFQSAEAQYRRILEIEPDHQLAPSLLAGSIGVQYRFGEALPMAEAAVQKAPKLLIPRLIFASLLEEMERNDEAIVQAQEALALHPDSEESHRILGWVYLDLEDYRAAFEEAEKALANRPTPETQRLFATTLAALGRREEAIAAIEAALREEPDLYSCHETAGYAFYLLKDYTRAESHYLRAMELDPSGLGCHGRLGLLYFDQRRIAEARSLLEKSNSLNPHSRRVRAALAAIAAQSSR